MKRLLIVAILIISTAHLYAQGQQQNVDDKLNVDTRNAVGVIGADRHKAQVYCQILELERQQADDQEKNNNKKKDRNKDKNRAEALSQKINQLQKQLGPEFVTIDNVLHSIDLQSPDGREIALIIQSLISPVLISSGAFYSSAKYQRFLPPVEPRFAE